MAVSVAVVNEVSVGVSAVKVSVPVVEVTVLKSELPLDVSPSGIWTLYLPTMSQYSST